MGLIRAAVGAVSGTLKDQWKEAIRCEEMGNDILMVKKTTPTGVITNQSTVIVGPGQCAIIYDNGRVLDATAEEGIYTFDSSSSPSFFAGQFGAVFKEMWQRFTFNGATAKQQAVFFFNIKEIMDNKFGTPAPIPFQDWSHPIPNQMTNTITPLALKVKVFGKYTFKIEDPAKFMSEIAGMADVYRKDDITEQMRTEVIAVFQNVVNELGTAEHKVPALELPSQTDEIKEMMDNKVFDEKIRERGLKIVTFAVESVTLDEDSEQKITNYELSSNSYMQQGTMVGAYSNAIQDAAKNEGGAANGFMGIGMMNMAAGNIAGAAFGGNVGQGNTKDMSENDPFGGNNDSWTCECGATNPASSKFCGNCGKERKSDKKFCPKCGAEVAADAKFCGNCGAQL